MTISLLIGHDYYYDFVGSDQLKLPRGLIFLDTKLVLLKFIPAGRAVFAGGDDSRVLTTFASHDVIEDPLNLKKFRSLKEIEIREDAESPFDSNQEVVRKFEDKVQCLNDCYVVSWPWKDIGKVDNLTKNFELSFNQRKSLVKRISKTPEALKKYDQTIQEQLAMGFVVEVHVKGGSEEHPQCKHYTPHHCVNKPDSQTTRIRMVNDTSTKAKSAYY